jgi:dTDP-4-amino-4,6-dideoxygalactose transaminase
VITQAFSCYAVEEGIVRAGMKAVYADVGTNSINLDIETLSEALKKYPNAKAVLVQHSLGVPADSAAIKKWCDQHGLLMVDDVAQGVGGLDEIGEIIGKKADAVILSFGKDKIIDAVSGGSVVVKNMDEEKRERLEDVKTKIGKLPFHIVYQDMIYPDLTSFIRRTHHFGLGKVIFVAAKALDLLGSPIMSRTHKMTWMHPAYAKLALLQYGGLEKQLEHRRTIALEYFDCFQRHGVKDSHQGGIEMLITKEEIKRASNQRFNIRLSDFNQVEKVVTALKKQRIYISDRWYRKAVDCGSFACKTAYQNGSCPNAELLATQIINLPTHREINSKIVKKICKIIADTIN